MRLFQITKGVNCLAEERIAVKGKSILMDKILPFVFITSMLVGIFLWHFKKDINMGYSLFCFGLMGICFICPLIDFFTDASSGTSEKLLMRGVKLFLKGTFMACAIYTGYRIIFTYPIIKDREYWLYNLIVLIGLILIFIDIIKRIRKTFISIKLKEDEGYEKLLMGIMMFMLSIFTAMRMYDLCIYKNTADLSQMKKPYGIMFKITDREEHKITDNELINQFYNELTKIKVGNMRGIDAINYAFWQDKSKLLLDVHPMYKSPNGKDENDFNFEDGYIYKIEVYEKDLVLLLFQNKNDSYRVTRYHIQLSNQLINEFLKLKEKETKQ